MSVTLSDLKTRIRYLLRDTTSLTFADAELLLCINESQNETAAFLCKQEGDFLLREATATLVDGQTDYPYPADIFGRNIRALFVYGTDPTLYRKIERATLEEVYEEGMVKAAYPRKYCCLDAYFKLSPPPDDSEKTLRIDYIRQPTALAADADPMDADDEFKELVCVSAALRALEPRGGKESIEILAQRQVALMAEAARLITKEDILQAKLAWKY